MGRRGAPVPLARVRSRESPGAPPVDCMSATLKYYAAASKRTTQDLTGIMEAQAGGDYTTPDYPFVMTYVDEETRSSS